MTETKRINITQPADHVAAWKVQAELAGYPSLSEWIGACCYANLPSKVASKLSERATRGGDGGLKRGRKKPE